MLEVDDIKVIDLGGVTRFTNSDGDIYSTVGYAAPELATKGPSPASDIYTLARTMAVLCTEFRGFQNSHEHQLRTPDEEPVYARYESFYRFLAKARRIRTRTCVSRPATKWTSSCSASCVTQSPSTRAILPGHEQSLRCRHAGRARPVQATGGGHLQPAAPAHGHAGSGGGDHLERHGRQRSEASGRRHSPHARAVSGLARGSAGSGEEPDRTGSIRRCRGGDQGKSKRKMASTGA